MNVLDKGQIFLQTIQYKYYLPNSNFPQCVLKLIGA